MKTHTLFLIFNFSYLVLLAQANHTQQIDSLRLKRHLSIIASDSLEGRNTGEKGQWMAADYIQNSLTSSGLKCFSQRFEVFKKYKSGSISILGENLSYPSQIGFNGFYETLLWQGKIKIYTDLKSINWSLVDSTIVLGLMISSYKEFDTRLIPKNNAKAIMLFCKTFNQSNFTQYDNNGLAYSGQTKTTLLIYVDAKKIKKLGKRIKKELNVSLTINPNMVRQQTENVLTLIEGTDAKLKNEIIVISAHYDHLGIENGLVYNGADDNGSGTVALLELARVFQQAKLNNEGNKRSILFIWFTGEEHGLFGSSYYTEHPYLPLKQTITNLNIDMVGRADLENEKEQYKVYVIGSDRLSMDLHNANELAAKSIPKLKLDYTYNDPNDKLRLYYRSDHYNFAKNGVPSIFYFGGFHDDYHQATDDIEKINYSKIKEVASLVYLTAWQLANAPQRPQLNH